MGLPMNTQQLLNSALNGLDRIGFQLDQYGITGKLNRHNLAAFIMLEQKHLEGEWDSIQAKFDRRRSQIDGVLDTIEMRAKPLVDRLNQFRGTSKG